MSTSDTKDILQHHLDAKPKHQQILRDYIAADFLYPKGLIVYLTIVAQIRQNNHIIPHKWLQQKLGKTGMEISHVTADLIRVKALQRHVIEGDEIYLIDPDGPVITPEMIWERKKHRIDFEGYLARVTAAAGRTYTPDTWVNMNDIAVTVLDRLDSKEAAA